MHPLHRARRVRAYHGPLATRIEERPMPVSRTKRRMKRVGNRPGPAPQLDLFGDDRPRTIVDTPAWPDLPAETRATLTGLMARLIIEHAEFSTTHRRIYS